MNKLYAKITISIIFLITALVMLMGSSRKNAPGQFLPTPKILDIPQGWPKPATNIFAKNPLTEEGFALGKKLFHDGLLSRDGVTSCGSCHQQFAAFSTYDHDLSHGIENTFTTRNAPALFNLAWMTSYHWDGGVNHIEVQPLSPLTAPNEMGETIENVIKKIKTDSSYSKYFKAAFGSTTVTSKRILQALSQFTGSLISSNSKYDQWKADKVKFTPVEIAGYNLYVANCSSCHPEPLFTDNQFRNNGLSLNRFKDIGRMQITGDVQDSLKFKVPSLRNVQYSVPYMHDGRFNDLDKVITHYTKVLDSSNSQLDPILLKKIHFSEKEKQQLIYFLYTLTDTSFTKNKKFAP